jgi:hypothetical protein
MTIRFFLPASVVALGLSGFAACTPYDPDLGSAPFLCGPMDQSPRCPDNYACVMQGATEYCVKSGGSVPVDSRPANCADDSQLEPNDSITSAFQTPVATQKNTLTFAGLAICPGGDKDTYSITITATGQNLEMIFDYDDGGAELQGALLNSSGVPIQNASLTTTARQKKAMVANLPAGTFYAQVYGPNSGGLTTNNYKLTINVTGP